MISQNTIDRLAAHYNTTVVSSAQLLEFGKIMKAEGASGNEWNLLKHARDGHLPKLERGKFSLQAVASVTPISPPVKTPVAEAVAAAPAAPVRGSATASIKESACEVPALDPEFVPFGIFKDLFAVLKSGVYAPVMIPGDSGNGKTLSVRQACAKLKRKLVSVSMDTNTTDDELIGKFGLVDGNTVYERGPVRIAMEEGAVLLLDELDRGEAENLICLNAILDGYPVLDKKTGETIYPKPGFMVVCTANTKGQGDDTDRFTAAQILDEAFLERFPVVLEQSYPTAAVETKILGKVCQDEELVANLVKWANTTRETYQAGGVGNFITTRRLKFIAGKLLPIFGNPVKAVQVGCARFPAVTRDSFVELFKAIHGGDLNAQLNLGSDDEFDMSDFDTDEDDDQI